MLQGVSGHSISFNGYAVAKIAFSDTGLRSLPAPERGQKSYWDAKLPAFGVRVSQGGTKTFVVNRDNSLITIGRLGVVTLSEARTEAKRLMAERTLGKVRPQSISYQTVLELFLTEKKKSRRANTTSNLEFRLKRHFYFKCQLSEVTHQDIARRLAKIPTNAEHDHALSTAKTFFTWAMNRRYIDDSPTRGLSPHGSQSRSRVLTDAELKSVWEVCEQTTGGSVAQNNLDFTAGRLPASYATIVKLLILSGQRRGEIAALQTSWIQNDTITLPKEITKNGREHTFPTGELSYRLIASLEKETSSTGLLFPARGTSPPSPFNGWSKSKNILDELSGVRDWTLHDLRRTFATSLAEMGVAPHVIERLLNHVTGSLSPIALVYNKAKYLEEMRAAVNLWEHKLTTIVG